MANDIVDDDVQLKWKEIVLKNEKWTTYGGGFLLSKLRCEERHN